MSRIKNDTLSEEDIAQYKEVFTLFDRDGDGVITPKELVGVLEAFGLDPTESEMVNLIKRVEIEKNSVIDFNEFLSIMTAKAGDGDADEAEEEEELREAFKMFDIDGNGFLDMVELENLFRIIDEKVTEKEFQNAVKLVDTDGDGKINFSEFKQFVIASK